MENLTQNQINGLKKEARLYAISMNEVAGWHDAGLWAYPELSNDDVINAAKRCDNEEGLIIKLGHLIMAS